MSKYVKILTLASFLIVQAIAGAGMTVDQMMRAELSMAAQMDRDEQEDYDYPLTGEGEDSPFAKSPGRAALYSLILPGAGQYYIHGSSVKAKLFFGLETGLWLGYLGFRKFGEYKEDAAKGWAVVHAGAYADNGDEEYWIKMTYYDNRDRNEDDGLGYNQMALVYDRGDAVIFPETPNYYWNWDGRESRQVYRNLRNQSKTAFERSDISLGIILANHIVSAIEAYFSAGKYNRNIEFSDTGFNLKYDFKANPVNPSVSLSLVKNF